MNEVERMLGVSEPPSGQRRDANTPAELRNLQDLVTRYRDAYRVAAWQVGIGEIVKIAGIVVGVLLALLGFSASSGPFSSGSVAFTGVIMGAIVGGFIWCIGVFIVCQGQVLRATLDTAVSGSTFLTNTQRAEAMGLPVAAPAAER